MKGLIDKMALFLMTASHLHLPIRVQFFFSSPSVRECLTGGFLRAVSHESFVPLQAEQHAAPRD